jgi:glutathione S-transferase
MATPELFQFQYSHYNEKARWALDYKGVAHVRRSVLPGPHALQIARLSGQPQVPVLRVDGEPVKGSSEIIDYLERHHPEPPLYPEDPAERERAFAIRDEFDAEVGPAVRVALFHETLPESDYLARMFSTGKGAVTRTLYRAMMPVVGLVMKRSMKIGPQAAARGEERTREALDFVAKNAGPEGYLVGSRFSVADLTAAALLMISCYPPELQPPLPEPRSSTFESWLAQWTDHPGTAWVREMFKRHRGHSAEVTA